MTEARIFRIIVPVSDVDAARLFYEDLFGQEGRNVGGGRCYFDFGAVIMALLKIDKPPISEYIYFAVADIEKIYLKAAEMDCLAEGEIHGAPAGEIIVRPWGERSFYAADPFGNGLCVVDETTLFTGR